MAITGSKRRIVAPRSSTITTRTFMRYSCQIIIRKDVPRKDGTCLLCLQAFINGKRVVIQLDLRATPEEFDERERLFKTDHPDATDNNIILRNAIGKANEIFKRARL